MPAAAPAAPPYTPAPVLPSAPLLPAATVAGVVPPSPVLPPPIDPRREYVAAAADSWWVPSAWAARALPPAIDDVTADFGADLYVRMQHNSAVASAVQFLRTTAVAKPLSLTERGPDPALAARVAAFDRRALDALPRPIEAVLYDLSAAVAEGWQAAELILRAAVWDGVPVWVYADVKPKPPHALAPVVDRYGTHLGYRIRVPGRYTLPALGPVLPDDPTFVPRSKFAHYAFRPHAGDPRGTSALRPVYHLWWMMQQLWPEWLAYQTQFARPMLVVTTAPDAQEIPGPDLADGTAGPSVSPTQAAVDAAAAMRGGGVYGNPYGGDLKALAAPVGDPFLASLTWFVGAITQGILGASLATLEGTHQARAASLVHQDVVQVPVRFVKQGLCAVVEDDLLHPLNVLNFGPEIADLYTPEASLGVVDAEDFGKNGAIVAQLYTSGFLDASDKPFVKPWLGLPVTVGSGASGPSAEG